MHEIIKIIYHKQSFLLIPILICLNFSVNLIYRHVSDQIPHKGVVSFIDSKPIGFYIMPSDDEPMYYYFRIKIDTEPHATYKMSVATFPSYLDYIRQSVKRGDTITIFTTPYLAWQKIKQRGFTNVVKLTKKKRVIVNYTANHDGINFSQMIIFTALFIAFLILYFFLLIRRLSYFNYPKSI